MPDDERGSGPWPDPNEEDIVVDDRRISRPDSRLPDWYIPDASYRPIPIVWFTAAALSQMLALTIIFFVLIGKSGWFTILLAGLASGYVLYRALSGGLGRSGTAWRIAIIAVVLLQFAFVSIGASSRF